jgi:hypothetical protein
MMLHLLAEIAAHVRTAPTTAAPLHLNDDTVVLAQELVVPDPPPKPIPGLEEPVTEWLGYLKWACGIAAFIGLLCTAIMMGVGIRGRSDAAKWALGHAPWALGGAVLAGSAAALVAQVS